MIALQKTLGRVLVVTGALAFLLWGYLMGHGLLFQRAASRMLEEQISRPNLAREQRTAPLDTAITPLRKGQAIGRLDIPRINVSVIVLEGSDSRILDVAAGHIPGTALPGATGNIGIAAHRDTFFRSLREIRPNDRLTFTTPIRTFEYGVESTEVVDPENVGVLAPTVDAELTLVTCYPFNYIGAAPKRFIVHARQWN